MKRTEHGATRHNCESDAFRSRRWRHVNRDWPDPINRPDGQDTRPGAHSRVNSRVTSDDVGCVRMDEPTRTGNRVNHSAFIPSVLLPPPSWTPDARNRLE